MPRRLLAILALLAVVFAILTALAVRSGVLGADGQGQGQAAIGGPFTLRDTAGPVDQEALKGKWSAVFFGFTYCPDVCPMDLSRNALAAQELAERDVKTGQVFVTIDPARDTPEVVRDFTAAIDPGLVGLTGSPDEIAAAAKAYKVFFRRNGNDPEYYLMDHSTFTYLMAPQVGFLEFYASELDPSAVAESVACYADRL